MTVACVMKTGGRYDMSWVARLRRSIHRHHPDVRFVCLTDSDEPAPADVECISLMHGWPGWWSKIELFRPGAFTPDERVVYLDLDVVVMRPITQLLRYNGEFAALRGFIRTDGLNSSVMAFRAGAPLVNDIYSPFAVRHKTIMRRLRREGDQDWIRAMAELDADRLQDVLPAGYVQSLKVDGLVDAAEPPKELRILVLHGRPKMPDLPTDHWARVEWERN